MGFFGKGHRRHWQCFPHMAACQGSALFPQGKGFLLHRFHMYFPAQGTVGRHLPARGHGLFRTEKAVFLPIHGFYHFFFRHGRILPVFQTKVWKIDQKEDFLTFHALLCQRPEGSSHGIFRHFFQRHRSGAKESPLLEVRRPQLSCQQDTDHTRVTPGLPPLPQGVGCHFLHPFSMVHF